jgi:hypothetical protein
MYNTPQKFGIKTFEKEVMNSFWRMAIARSCVTIPITSGDIIFG